MQSLVMPDSVPDAIGHGGTANEDSVGPCVVGTACANSSLEEYAHALELRLTVKSSLLDEALRLQRSLEARLVALEEGLSWKDAQLAALLGQSNEACRERDAWRNRAARLEEENVWLRDVLLERADEKEQLLALLEVQAQQQHVQHVHGSGSGNGMSPQRSTAMMSDPDDSQVRHLAQQLKLGGWPAEDAWAAMGVATGGCILEDDSDDEDEPDSDEGKRPAWLTNGDSPSSSSRRSSPRSNASPPGISGALAASVAMSGREALEPEPLSPVIVSPPISPSLQNVGNTGASAWSPNSYGREVPMPSRQLRVGTLPVQPSPHLATRTPAAPGATHATATAVRPGHVSKATPQAAPMAPPPNTSWQCGPCAVPVTPSFSPSVRQLSQSGGGGSSRARAKTGAMVTAAVATPSGSLGGAHRGGVLAVRYETPPTATLAAMASALAGEASAPPPGTRSPSTPPPVFGAANPQTLQQLQQLAWRQQQEKAHPASYSSAYYPMPPSTATQGPATLPSAVLPTPVYRADGTHQRVASHEVYRAEQHPAFAHQRVRSNEFGSTPPPQPPVAQPREHQTQAVGGVAPRSNSRGAYGSTPPRSSAQVLNSGAQAVGTMPPQMVQVPTSVELPRRGSAQAGGQASGPGPPPT